MLTLTRIMRRAVEILAADTALSIAQAVKLAHMEISPETVIIAPPPDSEEETEKE